MINECVGTMEVLIPVSGHEGVGDKVATPSSFGERLESFWRDSRKAWLLLIGGDSNDCFGS